MSQTDFLNSVGGYVKFDKNIKGSLEYLAFSRSYMEVMYNLCMERKKKDIEMKTVDETPNKEIEEQVTEVLWGVKKVEVLKKDRFSALVKVTFKSGQESNGVYYPPGDGFPFADVELED